MFIRVQGLVQGVGFRPFVSRLATEMGLSGWVRNTSAKVEILLQGQTSIIENFLTRLTKEAPPLARIDAISSELDVSEGQDTDLYANQYTNFTILPSADQPGKCQPITPVPPDASLCSDCAQELLTPSDRRYLYPFISCTNCGPRFTIIQDLPVDRQNTVMQNFPLCPACQTEYDNPLDRRFHAQASACPVCGPCLALHAPCITESSFPQDPVGARHAVPLHIIGQTHRSAPTDLNA
ncbi:MAG: acylphosphatase, partial [Candidatus Electrothrix sp.]